MTIYALSSGPGISGVAVIRISGPETTNVISKLTDATFPKPRVATLKKINKINTNEMIDEGIILWFPGPEILITAIPEVPCPLDKANIVIITVYFFNYFNQLLIPL